MGIQSKRLSPFASEDHLGSIESSPRATEVSPWLMAIEANVSMLLLRRLLQRIIHKGSLTVIEPNGRSYFVGHGAPSIAVRVVDPAAIPRLLLNPDLAIGEAYMDGALTVEGGDIYDFLDLCFANLGWGSGQGLRGVRASIKRVIRRITKHNPIPVARANVAHQMISRIGSTNCSSMQTVNIPARISSLVTTRWNVRKSRRSDISPPNCCCGQDNAFSISDPVGADWLSISLGLPTSMLRA